MHGWTYEVALLIGPVITPLDLARKGSEIRMDPVVTLQITLLVTPIPATFP